MERVLSQDPNESPLTHLANQITRLSIENAAIKAQNATHLNKIKHLEAAAIVARDKITALMAELGKREENVQALLTSPQPGSRLPKDAVS